MTPRMCGGCVRRGAIIVGKTNTPEFGLRPVTENDALRPDPQPVEHRALGRRLLRRERCRHRCGNGGARRWQRSRWLDPDSCVVLRTRRAQAEPRTGVDRPGLRRFGCGTPADGVLTRTVHRHGDGARCDRRLRAWRSAPTTARAAVPSRRGAAAARSVPGQRRVTAPLGSAGRRRAVAAAQRGRGTPAGTRPRCRRVDARLGREASRELGDVHGRHPPAPCPRRGAPARRPRRPEPLEPATRAWLVDSPGSRWSRTSRPPSSCPVLAAGDRSWAGDDIDPADPHPHPATG